MGNTPNVRFKGFTEDWEQRKFSDIAARESSISTSTTDVPSVEYEDVIAEEGRLNKDIHLKEAVKSGITFDGSQVLYGKLRPYLHNWLNPDFKGIAVGDWWVLKPINMDKKFLYRLIQTQQFDNIANQSSGSKMPRADWNLISNSEFMVPFSKAEQSKIGRYFDSLDHLITLHQQKCDETKEFKKYMLQNMFPQKDEKVPKIRFDGFTEDWEQRKVSEMFKVTRGYVLPATDTSQEMTDEMPYPVYSSQTKDNGLMGYYSDYLYEDAITWTTDGANAGTVNFRDGKFYCTNVCGVLLSDKIETSKVIAEALNNVAKRYVSYVGNPKLMNNVMADIQIAVPISKRERDQISSYFSYLDHLITLHQQKCNALKEFKKYMLQNMFPQKGENKCQN